MRPSTFQSFSRWAFALVLLALTDVAQADTIEAPSLFATYLKKSNTLHVQPRSELLDVSPITAGQKEGGSRRSLLDGCADCLNPTYTMYYGECPALSDRTDQWCGSYCCAASEEDCCASNDGAIAGVVIAIIVFLVASITACAYCCKCCCFRPKPQVVTVMQVPAVVQQPVTTV